MKTAISLEPLVKVCDRRCREYLQIINAGTIANEEHISSNWSPDIPRLICEHGKKGIVDRLLLDCINKSEHSAPGSGDLTFRLCVKVGTLIERCHTTYNIVSLLNALNESGELAKQNSKYPTGELLKGHLKTNFPCKLSSMILTTLSLCDVTSKIEIVYDKKCMIEAKDNFEFSCTFPELYKNSTLKNIKIAVIDGIVEELSEITHLIEHSRLSGDCLVLVTRGFSNEVLELLQINFTKGLLKIVPVTVKFDIRANTLIDIAVATNSDVKSSLKGDLISSIKYEELTVIPECRFTDDRFLISNEFSSETSRGHKLSLLRKRLELLDSHHDTTIIDERIRSLNSRQIVVKVNEKSDVQMLERSFKDITSMLHYGYSTCDWIAPLTAIDSQLFSESTQTAITPTKYIVVALQQVQSFLKNVLSVKASIFEDKST